MHSLSVFLLTSASSIMLVNRTSYGLTALHLTMKSGAHGSNLNALRLSKDKDVLFFFYVQEPRRTQQLWRRVQRRTSVGRFPSNPGNSSGWERRLRRGLEPRPKLVRRALLLQRPDRLCLQLRLRCSRRSSRASATVHFATRPGSTH